MDGHILSEQDHRMMQALRKVRRAVRSLPGSPLQPDTFNLTDEEDTSMSAMPVNNDLPVSTLKEVAANYLTNLKNSLAGMMVNRPFGQGGVQVGAAWNPRRVEGQGENYCYELAPGVMWHPARGIKVMPYADSNVKAKLLADFPELRHTL